MTGSLLFVLASVGIVGALVAVIARNLGMPGGDKAFLSLGGAGRDSRPCDPNAAHDDAVDRFHRMLSPGVAGGGDATGPGLHTAYMLARTLAFQRAQQRAPQRSIRVSRSESAKQLVSGLASLTPVTLFGAMPREVLANEEALLHDILESLGIAPGYVDVSADEDMHLGLPRNAGGDAVIPAVFLGGAFFGGAETTLEAIQSGGIAERLTEAGIDFDGEVAAALVTNRATVSD